MQRAQLWSVSRSEPGPRARQLEVPAWRRRLEEGEANPHTFIPAAEPVAEEISR